MDRVGFGGGDASAFGLSDEVYRLIFEASPVGVGLADEHGHFLAVNDSLCRLFGRPAPELLGRSSFAWTHPDDRADHGRAGSLVEAADDGIARVEKRFVRPSGEVRWAWLTFSHTTGPQGQTWTLAHMQDVTERILAEQAQERLMQELADLAETDELSGLANRRGWAARLPGLMNRAATSGGRLLVALADLDNFKGFNDAHGHAAGDRLIREFADAGRLALPDHALMARWGGEEFAIAVADTRPFDPLALVERVRRSVPAAQTCSVGYAVWDGAETGDDLINRADHALYRAKLTGRDRSVRAG